MSEFLERRMQLSAEIEYQIRSEDGSLRFSYSIRKAFIIAKKHNGIKISFSNGKKGEERIRLIRTEQGWVYENIYGDRGI